MGTRIIPRANSAVLAFLDEAVESVDIRSRVETCIHEFDDCQYFLSKAKSDPEWLRLSFKHAYPLSGRASLAISGAYQGFATVSEVPEPDFQVTLMVSAPYLVTIMHLYF